MLNKYIKQGLHQKIVSDILKKSRKRLGLSKADLCRKLSLVSVFELSAFESNRKVPIAQQLSELLTVYSSVMTDDEKLFFSTHPSMYDKVLSTKFKSKYLKEKDLF